MTEPTDEMVTAAYNACRGWADRGMLRRALTAALAIVERNLPRCPYVEWGFKVRLCSLPFGHDGDHDLADRVIL